MLKKLALAILFLLLSEQAFAYDGWSRGVIKEIRLQAGRILIIQENAANPGNCSNTDYINLHQGDAVHLKNMYSALLTAYATKSNVQLALTGCTGGGTTGYPVISEVWIL
ncbi:hypothetical protein N474_01840 [Pseudoalteromonas luteoviolacea CPMOR-2]|uniref:hypothetical protein n=1 Tax=Pseudoalteromonas luteoviolacea TaxID=43657 RepID=UPI0007B060F0|nr:hypothetical protein [Pseudoalteromonas luteoviolacea]KZN54485.1 hypothetical protein N474_01840 [Pseudoalteromonas luteoviolacea CPMOR-2]